MPDIHKIADIHNGCESSGTGLDMAYTLRVRSVLGASSFTLSRTYPVTAEVDLELYQGTTKVAEATSVGRHVR